MSVRLKLPTLLLVSSNPSIRSRVRKELESQFFIIEADRESEVFEIARSTALEFVILDSRVEDCDWNRLSQTIRNSSLNLMTPIYLITGRLSKTFRKEAAKAGVTAFLTDQLDPEELNALISTGRKTEKMREKTSELFNKNKKDSQTS